MIDSPSTLTRKVLSYLVANRRRLYPFLVVGGTAFVLNWGLFKGLRLAGMSSPNQVYLAFVLSMEVSIVYNFMLQYLWTWRDSARARGWKFFLKLLAFHGAVGVGALVRLGLFRLGQTLGLQDDLNFVIGVAAATGVDFVLYDKAVFGGAPYWSSD